MPDVPHIDNAIRAYAKSKEWTERGDAEIEAAYTVDRLSLNEIADRLDLTAEAVRQRLLVRDVELRSRGGRKA